MALAWFCSPSIDPVHKFPKESIVSLTAPKSPVNTSRALSNTSPRRESPIALFNSCAPKPFIVSNNTRAASSPVPPARATVAVRCILVVKKDNCLSDMSPVINSGTLPNTLLTASVVISALLTASA